MALYPDQLLGAPYVGFGDVKFGIRHTNAEGGYIDWTYEPNIRARHIPGSNRTIVQNMGASHAVWQPTLHFGQRSDYLAFQAMLGTSDTLGVLADMQSMQSATGFRGTRHRYMYDFLEDVMLVNVGQPQYAIDGTVETTATFWRAINPLTGAAT